MPMDPDRTQSRRKAVRYISPIFLRLYLYEASCRPRTLCESGGEHSPEGNWLEIDEDGNVTHRFNEKRGFDYD